MGSLNRNGSRPRLAAGEFGLKHVPHFNETHSDPSLWTDWVEANPMLAVRACVRAIWEDNPKALVDRTVAINGELWTSTISAELTDAERVWCADNIDAVVRAAEILGIGPEAIVPGFVDPLAPADPDYLDPAVVRIWLRVLRLNGLDPVKRHTRSGRERSAPSRLAGKRLAPYPLRAKTTEVVCAGFLPAVVDICGSNSVEEPTRHQLVEFRLRYPVFGFADRCVDDG